MSFLNKKQNPYGQPRSSQSSANKKLVLIGLIIVTVIILIIGILGSGQSKQQSSTSSQFSNALFSISKPADFSLSESSTEFVLANDSSSESITISKFLSNSSSNILSKVETSALKNLDGSKREGIEYSKTTVSGKEAIVSKNQAENTTSYYIVFPEDVWKISFKSSEANSTLLKESSLIIASFKVN